jgi:YidC/Oxa1 family membrane protein insertase
MKKTNKLVVLILLIMLTSACGADNYLKDENNQPIKYSVTGQTLQKDILCRPSSDTELYNIYVEHEDQLDYKLNDLPECKDFQVNSNESKSIWQYIFVKPIAYLIIKLGYQVNNLGLSVVLIGLLIRLILMPFQIKSQNQSKKMQEATPEIQRLEIKYKDKTDQASLQAKSQETLMIYKKYHVSPLLGCLLAFIQLPLFFAFLQALYRIPTIYEESFLGMNLGTTPWVGMSSGNYLYFVLLLLIAGSTYFSFKYSMSQTSAPSTSPEMKKQTDMMMNVMIVMVIITSFTLPTAIGLYWIVTYAFISVQTYFVNLYNKKHDNKKVNRKEGKKYEKSNKRR